MAKYGNLNDETLVNLSLIGEDGAFDELMARYEDAVLEKAEQIVGNPFSAEDIAQDTFFSAWEHLGELRFHAGFGTWILRIAENHAKTLLRWYKSDLSELVADMDSFPLPASGRITDGENRDRLRGAVNALTNALRDTVQLHYIDGFSVREIADDPEDLAIVEIQGDVVQRFYLPGGGEEGETEIPDVHKMIGHIARPPLLFQFGVKRIAQPVAEQVEAEDDQADENGRGDQKIRIRVHPVDRRACQTSQTGQRHGDAESEERQIALREDGGGDLQGRGHDQRADAVRQQVLKETKTVRRRISQIPRSGLPGRSKQCFLFSRRYAFPGLTGIGSCDIILIPQTQKKRRNLHEKTDFLP